MDAGEEQVKRSDVEMAEKSIDETEKATEMTQSDEQTTPASRKKVSDVVKQLEGVIRESASKSSASKADRSTESRAQTADDSTSIGGVLEAELPQPAGNKEDSSSSILVTQSKSLISKLGAGLRGDGDEMSTAIMAVNALLYSLVKAGKNSLPLEDIELLHRAYTMLSGEIREALFALYSRDDYVKQVGNEVEQLKQAHERMVHKLQTRVFNANPYKLRNDVRAWVASSPNEVPLYGGYGLSRIWWSQEMMTLFASIRGGFLFDEFKQSNVKAIKLTKLTGTADEMMNKNRFVIREELEEVDLSAQDNDSLMPLLASRLTKPLYYLPSDEENVPQVKLGIITDEELEKLKRFIGPEYKKIISRSKNRSTDRPIKITAKKQSLAELIDRMVMLTCEDLEEYLIHFATADNGMSERRTVNTQIFKFKLVGSSRFRCKQSSVKHYLLEMDEENYLGRIALSLRCPSVHESSSTLAIEVVGEVNLTQKRMVEIYSRCRTSPGMLCCSLTELIDVQRRVWDSFYEHRVMDVISCSETRDYTLINKIVLIPVMAVSGLAPPMMSSEDVALIWRLAMEGIMSGLNNDVEMLDTEDDRQHFLDCLYITSVVSSSITDPNRVYSMLVNMALMCITDRAACNYRAPDMTQVLSKSSSGPRQIVRTNKHGNQALWVASCLYTPDMLCKVGYSDSVYIILYNFLVTSRASIKLVGMGTWLMNMLSAEVDRDLEDAKVVSNLAAVGIVLSPSDIISLRAVDQAASKIAKIQQVMDNKLGSMNDANVLSPMSSEEALLVLRVVIDNKNSGMSTLSDMMKITLSDSNVFEKAIMAVVKKVTDMEKAKVMSSEKVEIILAQIDKVIADKGERLYRASTMPDVVVNAIARIFKQRLIAKRVVDADTNIVLPTNEDVMAVLKKKDFADNFIGAAGLQALQKAMKIGVVTKAVMASQRQPFVTEEAFRAIIVAGMEANKQRMVDMFGKKIEVAVSNIDIDGTTYDGWAITSSGKEVVSRASISRPTVDAPFSSAGSDVKMLSITDSCGVITTMSESRGAREFRKAVITMGLCYSDLHYFRLEFAIDRAMKRSETEYTAKDIVIGDVLVLNKMLAECATLDWETMGEIYYKSSRFVVSLVALPAIILKSSFLAAIWLNSSLLDVAVWLANKANDYSEAEIKDDTRLESLQKYILKPAARAFTILTCCSIVSYRIDNSWLGLMVMWACDNAILLSVALGRKLKFFVDNEVAKIDLARAIVDAQEGNDKKIAADKMIAYCDFESNALYNHDKQWIKKKFGAADAGKSNFVLSMISRVRVGVYCISMRMYRYIVAKFNAFVARWFKSEITAPESSKDDGTEANPVQCGEPADCGVELSASIAGGWFAASVNVTSDAVRSLYDAIKALVNSALQKGRGFVTNMCGRIDRMLRRIPLISRCFKWLAKKLKKLIDAVSSKVGKLVDNIIADFMEREKALGSEFDDEKGSTSSVDGSDGLAPLMTDETVGEEESTAQSSDKADCEHENQKSTVVSNNPLFGFDEETAEAAEKYRSEAERLADKMPMSPISTVGSDDESITDESKTSSDEEKSTGKSSRRDERAARAVPTGLDKSIKSIVFDRVIEELRKALDLNDYELSIAPSSKDSSMTLHEGDILMYGSSCYFSGKPSVKDDKDSSKWGAHCTGIVDYVAVHPCGKCVWHNCSKEGRKTFEQIEPMDIIDLDDCSVLVTGEYDDQKEDKMIPRMVKARGGKDGLAYPDVHQARISTQRGDKNQMWGYASLITDKQSNTEHMMSPAHLNHYGVSRRSACGEDQIVCLATCSVDSDLCDVPELTVKSFDSDHKAVASDCMTIMVTDELRCASKRFKMVLANNQDWCGKSGVIATDHMGRFLGICIMQIKQGRYPKLVAGKSILILATDMEFVGKIYSVDKMRVELCSTCNIQDEEKSFGVLEEVSRQLEEEKELENTDEAGSSATEEERETDAETDKSGKTGWMARIMSKLFGPGDMIVEATSAVHCGVLEKLVEINSRDFRSNVNMSDANTVALIRRLTSDLNVLKLNSNTRLILDYVANCLLTEERSVIVFSSNAMALSTCCLLSVLGIRFYRLRSPRDMKVKTDVSDQSEGLFVAWAEDILLSCCNITSLPICGNKKIDKALLLAENDDLAVHVMRMASTIVACYVDSVSIVVLSENRSRTDSSEIEYGKDRYISTGFEKNMQNPGHMIRMDMSSSVISTAILNAGGKEALGNSIVAVVITSCYSKSTQEILQARAATRMELNKSKVLCIHYSMLTTKSMWETVRCCRIVVLHTGTSLEGDRAVIMNCGVDYVATSDAEETILDSYTVAEFMFEDDCRCNVTSSRMKIGVDKKNCSPRPDSVVTITYDGKSHKVTLNGSDLYDRIMSIKMLNEVILPDKGNYGERLANARQQSTGSRRFVDKALLLNSRVVLAQREREHWDVLLSDRIENMKRTIRVTSRKMNIAVGNVAEAIRRRVKSTIDEIRDWFEWILSKTRSTIRGWFSRMYKATMAKLFNAKPKFTGVDDEECSYAEAILSRVKRTIAAAIAYSNIVNSNTRGIVSIDAAASGGLAWFCSDTLLSSLGGPIYTVFKSISNVVSTVILASELVSAIFGVRYRVRAGAVNYKTASLIQGRDVWQAIKDLSQWTSEMVMTSDGQSALVVEHTGELASGDPSNLLRLTALGGDLLNRLFRLVRNFFFESKLRDTIGAIWKNFKSKLDSPPYAQGVLSAVPCWEPSSVTAALIVTTIIGSVALKRGIKRAEHEAAMIGVMSEKKHTADTINLYLQDREFYCWGSRMVTAGYIALCYFSWNITPIRVMSMGLSALLLADYVAEKKSDLGVAYCISNCVSRIVVSANPVMAFISGFSSWWRYQDNPSLVLNCIAITGGSMADTEFNMRAETRFRLDTLRKMIVEQRKELEANMILMDKTGKPFDRYRSAAQVYGIARPDLDTFEKIWAVDERELDQYFNMSQAARRRAKEFVLGDKSKDVIVQLRDVTENQCRYMGRSLKISDFEDISRVEYSDKQLSLFAIDERLWQGIVDLELRAKYESAGDSRSSVLLAIAERNDLPARFNIDIVNLNRATKAAVEIIKRSGCSYYSLSVKTVGLQTVTILNSVNEKSTSGILARRRTGMTITAGFMANHLKRCEIYKEMIDIGCAPEDSMIVNVFAKRRIEKKKISRLTGEDCVITRTIQANEAENKIANVEIFSVLDKVLKLERCNNLMAIGLNFFCEYGRDDMRCLVESMKQAGDKTLLRIALDHSSYDGSQRNWSIELTKEMRMKMIDLSQTTSQSKSEIKDYLTKCYQQLKIRLMLTAKGDLFAVTGQQMSGHATTSSDNSMKSLMYVLAIDDCLRKKGIEVIIDSIRTQGDDTKFNVLCSSAAKDYVKSLISRFMDDLGQITKPEKMEVVDWDEGCSFLSHKAELKWFEMVSSESSKRWLSAFPCPTRPRKEVITLIALVLKTTEKGMRGKSNLSLLAAKCMSFLSMFATDGMMSSFCAVAIWLCFLLLTKLGKASLKMDISDSKIPWLLTQADIKGEFEMDIDVLLEMHSISTERSKATKWIMINDQESTEMIDMTSRLVDNFKRVFREIRESELESVRQFTSYLNGKRNKTIIKIKVSKVMRLLKSYSKGLKLAISQQEVVYAPYTEMKRAANNNIKEEDKMKRWTRAVVAETDYEKECAIAYVKEVILGRESEITTLEVTAKGMNCEGLAIDCGKIMQVETKEERIAIVKSERIARALDVSSWKILKIVLVGEREVINLENEITAMRIGKFDTISIDDLTIIRLESDIKGRMKERMRWKSREKLRHLASIKKKICGTYRTICIEAKI